MLLGLSRKDAHPHACGLDDRLYNATQDSRTHEPFIILLLTQQPPHAAPTGTHKPRKPRDSERMTWALVATILIQHVCTHVSRVAGWMREVAHIYVYSCALVPAPPRPAPEGRTSSREQSPTHKARREVRRTMGSAGPSRALRTHGSLSRRPTRAQDGAESPILRVNLIGSCSMTVANGKRWRHREPC